MYWLLVGVESEIESLDVHEILVQSFGAMRFGANKSKIEQDITGIGYFT